MARFEHLQDFCDEFFVNREALYLLLRKRRGTISKRFLNEKSPNYSKPTDHELWTLELIAQQLEAIERWEQEYKVPVPEWLFHPLLVKLYNEPNRNPKTYLKHRWTGQKL